MRQRIRSKLTSETHARSCTERQRTHPTASLQVPTGEAIAIAVPNSCLLRCTPSYPSRIAVLASVKQQAAHQTGHSVSAIQLSKIPSQPPQLRSLR